MGLFSKTPAEKLKELENKIEQLKAKQVKILEALKVTEKNRDRLYAQRATEMEAIKKTIVVEGSRFATLETNLTGAREAVARAPDDVEVYKDLKYFEQEVRAMNELIEFQQREDNNIRDTDEQLRKVHDEIRTLKHDLSKDAEVMLRIYDEIAKLKSKIPQFAFKK